MTEACLDDADLALFAHGVLDPAARQLAESHLRGCEACRKTLAVYVDLEAGDEPPSLASPFVAIERNPSFALGSSVGRYVLRERVGAGGMGVVYTAYDRELNRLVALKLLWGSADEAETSAARLRAEAQALAQIRDPHVVTVYEVKAFGDQVFMAMELIDGVDLAGWLAAAPRSWREVVTVFLQAGRGLAAAHAARLVHRDFKPSNVLMGRDGRVVVTDFGLAADSHHSPLEPSLVGTPAYMAPEQLVPGAAVVSPLADQFSFCVALFEALTGSRPFLATGGAERLKQMNEPLRWPQASRVPRWVRAVVEQGLAVEPARRFASMRALLVQLDPSQRERRSSLGWVAVVAGVCLVIGMAANAWYSRPRDACASNAWQGVWDEAGKLKLATAFQSLTLPYAPQSLDQATRLLDRYTADWNAAHATVCQTLPSASADDARLGCLLRQREEVRQVLAVLEQPDGAAVVEHAVHVAQALTPPSQCVGLRAESEPPLEPLVRAELNRGLAQARVDSLFGRFREASTGALRVGERAKTLSQPRTRAEALVAAASAQMKLGDLPTARQTVDEAMVASVAASAGEVFADAIITSMTLERTLAHTAEAERAGHLAEAALGTLPTIPTELGLRHDLNLALQAYDVGDLTKALVAAERAGSRLQHSPARPVELVYEVADTRAGVLTQLGRFDEAEALRRAVLDEFNATLGSFHPLRLKMLLSYAGGLAERGQPGAAVPQLKDASERAAKVLGPTHRLATQSARMLGWALINQAQFAEAEAALLRSLGQTEFPLAADHPTPIDLRFLFASIAYERTASVKTLGELSKLMFEERGLRPHEMLWPSFALDVIGAEIELGQLSQARALLHDTFEATSTNDALMRSVEYELEGRLEGASKHFDLATAAFEKARGLHQRMKTQDSVLYASLRHSEGVAWANAGQVSRAREAFLEAIALREKQHDLHADRSRRELAKLQN